MSQVKNFLQLLFQIFILLLPNSVICQTTSTPLCDYRNFSQSIDHFGAHNGTFPQRYSIFTQHFKPDGPILFFVGDEGSSLDCANNTVIYSFAKDLGGMAVSLEHRYFGTSVPLGNLSLTVDGYKYLTLDNVMADGVEFVGWLKKTIPKAARSRVLIVSGSYGAFLTTTMRQNHPDVFFASLSSAAPVTGFLRADNTSQGHDPDYTLQTYLAASYEATIKIRYAFIVMHEMLRNGSSSAVKESLNLCTTPPAYDESVIGTLDGIYDNAMTILLQYSYAQAEAGRMPVANSFELILNYSITSREPLSILKYGLSLFYVGNPQPCVNWTDAAAISQAYAPGVERSVFGYISCTYDPDVVGTIGHVRVFADNPNAPLSYAATLENCKKTYNATPMTEGEIYTRYHISPSDLANSSRIIFSNGEYDPISGLAPQSIPLSDDVCRSRVLWTNGMAHHEDLFAPAVGDKAEVVKTRQKEVELFKTWLAMCNDD